jgi:hypothetical protein
MEHKVRVEIDTHTTQHKHKWYTVTIHRLHRYNLYRTTERRALQVHTATATIPTRTTINSHHMRDTYYLESTQC